MDRRLDGGYGSDWIESGGGDDHLIGGHGLDRIDGGEGRDVIEGGLHADDLTGGAGDDTLVGGAGEDQLAGGEDDDSLEGGEHDDELTGGSGHDTFRFVYDGATDLGTDAIKDYEAGVDTLLIENAVLIYDSVNGLDREMHFADWDTGDIISRVIIENAAQSFDLNDLVII